ncbi:hypothetical protein [Paenibacillus azoreducens]|uniref:Uncharacterized protein n=1 Tax=Paenibacillus azoreducens TaxID=116718 RepID=A0A919YIA6_9BACL|nr:hypothetical protein [Paenibacillus azoreducens]GIO48847.1 hypothetical protein J34TS1_36120 [Paenibacillus azoreducens]
MKAGTDLVLNTGFGASLDTTQAGATGGSCAKFEFSDKGNGKATISGGVIEGILGNKAGQYTARARVKANISTSTRPLFALSVQDSKTFEPFPIAKGSTETSDKMFSAKDIGLDWTFVETSFYWDGVTPIELWTGRQGGYEPDVAFWEDIVEFVVLK